MDRNRAHAIQLGGLADFVALMGGASDGARVIERDGVTAGVVPATPRRSIPNSVTYRDAAALAAAYDELASAYEDAETEAWTVWTPDFDREAIELLEGAGHEFDGKPAAMVLDLDELGDPDLGDLDWDADGSMQTFGALNDAAYGLDEGSGYAPGLVRRPEGLELRLYQARVGGAVASVVGTIDHAPRDGVDGPDCGVYFVATPPEHRGRGLARRLMLAALREARDRGCTTSSLQASPMGEPIYTAMGYRPHFRLHLYERRSAR